MNVYHVLGQGNFLMANKHIARKTSLNAAVLLADLVTKRQYFIVNKDLSKTDWFFNTVENIQTDTTLSKHQQSKCLNQLKEAGFLDYNNKTVGNKRQFLIFDANIASFLLKCEEEVSNQKLKKGNPEVKKAEARSKKNGISYNNIKELDVTNNNKKEKAVGDILPVNVAFSIVASGGCVQRHQVTEETYKSLFKYYGSQDDGSIKRST